MLRGIIVILVMLFFFGFLGTMLLEEFPFFQPVFEEIKELGSTLYNTSLVKYGALPTIVLIIGLVIAIGSSKRL